MTVSHRLAGLASWTIAASFLFAAVARAQDVAAQAKPNAPDRWLLVCCGLPGDSGHRERFTDACRNIVTGAETVLDITPERITILAGDDEMRQALADEANDVGVCDKESVAISLQKFGEEIPADAGCWVVLLGHSHLYGSSSQFNVRGPDFDQDEFARWAKPIACNEQVFWLTMPISGFWTKPLAAETRVIISATEADLEFTGTEMPYAFGDLLVGEGEHQALEDVDRDGSLSLLDLYLAVNLEIHERFQATERLQTEHAQLEDNGDGRGSEVQQPYLPVENEEPSEDEQRSEDASAEKDAADEAESARDAAVAEAGEPTRTRPDLPNPIMNPILDGFRSRQIPIRNPDG